jgi:alkylation response protein AidB-like acyl-CoA dehydrogenase
MEKFRGVDYYGIDELLTEEQRMTRDAVRDWVEAKFLPVVSQHHRDGTFPIELAKDLGEMGVFGATLKGYGCAGLDNVAYGLIMQELERGDSGLRSFASVQSGLVMYPIYSYGTPEQKDRWLPKLQSGQALGCFGLTEPDHGSDPGSMKTRAVKKGDRYVLNGAKMWITNGPIADHFIVTAVTRPEGKALGISTFIVDKTMPGFRVGQHIEKMGNRTSTTAEILFEDCEVPEDNLLGQLDMGFVGTTRLILGWERSVLLAPALGGQRANLEACVAYAKERQQFGRPIAKFQAVRHMIADMQIRYELGRNLIHRVAWHLDTGEDPPMVEAAVAKLQVSEAGQQTARDAIQIHGGVGYTPELHVERTLRDAMLGTIGAGTSEIQRGIIARSILSL